MSTLAALLYNAQVTRSEICRTGFTETERIKDTYQLRDRVYDAYGLPRGHRAGFVIDHRLPLSLAGLTIPENLRPQRIAESHRKDRLEDALHAAVCSGEMSLDVARAEMLKQWP